VVDPSAFGDLHLVDDVSSADWIVASVRNFLYDVGSLLPVTFAAYGRVFHPAGRASAGGDQVEVPGTDVAAANGRIAHAVMEWVALTGDWRFMTEGGQPGVWDYPPSIGALPVRQTASLAAVLEHAAGRRSIGSVCGERRPAPSLEGRHSQSDAGSAPVAKVTPRRLWPPAAPAELLDGYESRAATSSSWR
jgi:hypothetical protein